MRTMKHIAIVLTFAAALAAQQGKAQQAKDPKIELAAIIAVEEQERDLAKAEKLYRAAISDAKLSEAARTQANLRLGTLLQKLDRAAEAKPFLDAAAKAGEVGFDDFGPKPQGQDIEREKALREKARELVQEIRTQSLQSWQPPLHGIANTPLAEQLLWIGEAAVPEVVAALEKEIETWGPGVGWDDQVSTRPRRSAVQGLAGFLWRTGGQASAAFLASVAKVEAASLRAAIVSTAFQAEQPEMLALAAKFLNDPDPSDKVVSSLLQSGSGQGGNSNVLQTRFEAKQIVDAGLRGPLRGKLRLLRWAARGNVFDAATLATLHKLVREGLQSTDPEFGNAANQFLLSTVSQTSIEGLELLLQELPKMKGANSVPNSLPELSPEVSSGKKRRFTAEEAARLLPALDACARAVPAVGDARRLEWFRVMIWHVAHASDATIVPTVLAWMDLGYNAWYGLVDRITPANCKDVFARFDRIPALEQGLFLDQLAQLDLPADMFTPLRDKAEQIRGSGAWNGTRNKIRDFSIVMAKTGNPEAADWLLADAARDEKSTDWMAEPLVTLGRRSQAENVRAALRKAARGGAQAPEHCCQALLALLSMGDVQALDIVVQKVVFPRATRHPYASNADSPLLTPLQYLLYKQPDPPHGFTDEQVIGVLQKIAANDVPQDWEPRFWSYTAISDRLLGELARISAVRGKTDWMSLVLERVRKSKGTESALHGWVAQMLQDEQPRVRRLVIGLLDESEVTHERALVEKCLDVVDDNCALCAAWALTKIATPIEPERLLQNKHAKVRIFAIENIPARLGPAGDKLVLPLTKDPDDEVRKAAASCLGALVTKDAVPALIAMLRDANEQVRSRATDALTRIRFFHEQQAHWDRVLKGLDASPASAAEKLLLQAKPGAAKDQRLLAIASLGALGVPEALPFLIEWSADPDADIAAKAKAAITQIHLNPRK